MKTKIKKPKIKKQTQLDKYKIELERLEKKYNKFLNPKDIVREASNPKSPLHDWFDWSDYEAGEKWRYHQARLLINHIKVKVMFEGTQKEYRKYLNVQIGNDEEDGSVRAYIDSKSVMNTQKYREQILRKAIQEAEYWKRCYDDYQELNDAFFGIEKSKRKLIKKKILVNA